MATGYCSDCTRNYLVGALAMPEYQEAFEVLRAAQRRQCEHARPGVTAESVDTVGREIIAEAGYGKAFMHRTGHGIYLTGRYGARIEDVVVCTADGVERLNTTTRDVVCLGD